jgi:hypothetical protein
MQPFLAEDDDNSALVVVAMQINLSTTKWSIFTLDVGINDTVYDLKEKVWEWCDDDVEAIRFIFDGKVLRGDVTLLTSYGICDQSLVYMEEAMTAFIMTMTDDSEIKMRPCWPTTTAILRLVNSSPIPAHRRRLIFNGQLLNDDQTLQHYDIKHNNTLFFVKE